MVASVSHENAVLVRGTGSIGMRHLRIFRDRLALPVLAVPSRASRRDELEKAGFPTLPVAEGPGTAVRLVVIATDTSQHVEDVRAYLPYGDILVEKPLAVDGTELSGMATSPEAQARVSVAYCLRFAAGMDRFRSQLDRLGRLHEVRIEAASYLPEWRPDRDYRRSYSARPNEGGVLRDLSHEFDYAAWLFGEPNRVLARLGGGGSIGIGVDATADVLWEYVDGLIVTFRLGYLSRIPRRGMRAMGSEGELEWNGLTGSVVHRQPNRRDERWTEDAARDEMMVRQARAALGLDRDARSRMCSWKEGVRIVELMDAMRRSHEGGRWVEVGE